jgi:ribosomal subunit interface protein
MQVTVTGRQVDVGEALRNHVATTLDTLIAKYFQSAIEAHAVFSREAHLIRAEISLHIGRGMVVNSGAAATEHYPAFDAAAERLAKRLRRSKRKRRDYHGKGHISGEEPQSEQSLEPALDVGPGAPGSPPRARR